MKTPNVYLALPHDAAKKSARALIMAMGLLPTELIDKPQALKCLVEKMLAEPQSGALLDLRSLPQAARHVLHLSEQLPLEIKKRVVLLRHDQGAMWPIDRLWIQELGFAQMLAEVDASAMLAAPEHLPALLAQWTGQAALSAQQLGGHFSAMNLRPDPASSRGLIRQHTAMSAESLTQALMAHVKSIDRTHRFKTYNACFLGDEATQWLSQHFRSSSRVAVQLGQALLQLGLVHHVMHEHEFENQAFFYRADATQTGTHVHLGKLFIELTSPQGLMVQDRSYHGTSYSQCWVGAEAVDWLHIKKKLPRHEAENLLNRLLSFGLIEHVLQAHRVKDGNYFYRFR